MQVKCTEQDLQDCMFGTENYGGCTQCGVITHYGCEPDAREYECPECGKRSVYGLEELMMMGMLDIEDE